MDSTGTDYAAEQQTHTAHATPSSATDEHPGDASDIPGSPTHPADHDCFPCQVLNHLARCVPSVLDPPTILWQAGCPVQPSAQLESQFAGHIAALLPARGPPFSIA